MIITAEPKKMDRTLAIGSSDMGSLFNLNPYGCQRRLWYEKRGVEADYPFLGNEHTRRGTFFEPIIAEYYTQRTGVELVTLKEAQLPIKDKEYSFIAGRPDRLVKRDGAPFEAKCPGRRAFAKVKTEGLNDEHILQIQHHIRVTNKEYGTAALLCAETVDFLHFDLSRDNDMIQMIVGASREFWGKVQKAIEPDRLDPKDARCGKCEYRTMCQGQALLEAMPEGDGEIITDESFAPLVEQYFEAKTIVDDAGAYLEEVKGKIKEKMDKAQMAETSGARIYYRPITSKRVDAKALRAAHPQIAEKFTKESISARLNIYPK